MGIYVYIIKPILIYLGTVLVFIGALLFGMIIDHPNLNNEQTTELVIIVLGLSMIYLDMRVTQLLKGNIVHKLVEPQHGIVNRPSSFELMLDKQPFSDQVILQQAWIWVEKNFYESVHWYLQDKKD